MKVVLFCGGLGTRLREHSNTLPKPMVNIGYRPIIWHLMKYYAHYGHKEFILCLGYKGDVIKDYFLHYDECVSNDFVLSDGGRRVELLRRDIDDWKISFIDTGLHSNIGERLTAVQPLLAGEEIFLANYTDGLSDVDLDRCLEWFRNTGKAASFLAVRPSHTFHVVDLDGGSGVRSILNSTKADLWINGGFFALRPKVFEYMRPGEELVEEPFQRMIEQGDLAAHPYEGFWACMDTFKDKQRFDDMHASGNRPWEVWNRASS